MSVLAPVVQDRGTREAHYLTCRFTGKYLHFQVFRPGHLDERGSFGATGNHFETSGKPSRPPLAGVMVVQSTLFVTTN